MTVKLIWATPDADFMIAAIARVSNPSNQANTNIEGLLNYMMREGHVSPFEMVNVCVEINTTRDIARQVLRHRSFSFQEFSQRYADIETLGEPILRECRLQDTKNRQNSLPCDDKSLQKDWRDYQYIVWGEAYFRYREAIRNGVAKEQARALLPEGLTPSRLYMNGTMRSWIHYLQSRLHPSTQKEHREIAEKILDICREIAPITIKAFFNEKA